MLGKPFLRGKSPGKEKRRGPLEKRKNHRGTRPAWAGKKQCVGGKQKIKVNAGVAKKGETINPEHYLTPDHPSGRTFHAGGSHTPHALKKKGQTGGKTFYTRRDWFVEEGPKPEAENLKTMML